MKHFLMKSFLRKQKEVRKSILAGMPHKITRMVASAVVLFLLASVFFLVVGGLIGSEKTVEASGTTTCPYCGDEVSQLYKCKNTSCDNSTRVGCTNPGIDVNGNPKCLYKYVYGAHCRKCDSPGKVVWP